MTTTNQMLALFNFFQSDFSPHFNMDELEHFHNCPERQWAMESAYEKLLQEGNQNGKQEGSQNGSQEGSNTIVLPVRNVSFSDCSVFSIVFPMFFCPSETTDKLIDSFPLHLDMFFKQIFLGEFIMFCLFHCFPNVFLSH